MEKEKHSTRSLLPDKPPKRTGKRAIGPKLDPVEDFDKPTTKQELSAPAKGSLLAEQPPRPKVVGDRMEVFYLKPIFGKTTKGDITVSMVVTVPLEEEHADIVPKIIHDGYKDILKKGRSAMTFKDLPGQHAVFYITHDTNEETLTLPAAKMLDAKLALVQRKGEGGARKVIRLSFRLQVKLSREVANFAEHNLQNSFWLSLKDTQEALFDEDGNE